MHVLVAGIKLMVMMMMIIIMIRSIVPRTGLRCQSPALSQSVNTELRRFAIRISYIYRTKRKLKRMR